MYVISDDGLDHRKLPREKGEAENKNGERRFQEASLGEEETQNKNWERRS
jgi:hypothetical protein